MQLERKSTLTCAKIDSPAVFTSVIQAKANLNPIQTINNEVICAGQTSNGGICLLHCRVNAGGSLEFTAKSNTQDTIDKLILQILP